MKLGKREIDALTCPPDRQDRLVFDEDLTGFGLRVTSGRQQNLPVPVPARQGGPPRAPRPYGDLTPAAARKLAEAMRGRVAAGADPAADARRRAAAEADADR